MPDYPQEETFVVRQLLEQIARAETWHDICLASDALFHVKLKAKSMRDEHKRFTQDAENCRAERVTAGVLPAGR